MFLSRIQKAKIRFRDKTIHNSITDFDEFYAYQFSRLRKFELITLRIKGLYFDQTCIARKCELLCFKSILGWIRFSSTTLL